MKKLISLLLAMMMLVPALGVAESREDRYEQENSNQLEVFSNEMEKEPEIILGTTSDDRRVNTTITFTGMDGWQMIGVDSQTAQAVNDLLEAIGLRISVQEEEIDGALQLSGQDVLTLGGAMKGDDFYLSSNLLGGAIVVAGSEVSALANKLMDTLVAMGMLTENDVAQLKAMMEQVMAELEAGVGQTINSAASLQNLEDINFSALQDMLTLFMGKITEVENPVVPRMCDAAVAGVQMTLTREDMFKGVKCLFRFLLDNPALMTMMELTQNDVTKALIQADSEPFGDMNIAVYVDDADIPVYATMNLATTENGKPWNLEITYTRQTVAAGVSYVVNITPNGRTASFDMLVSDGQITGNLYAVDGAKALDMNIKTTDNTLRAEINFFEGEDEKLLTILLEGECEYTAVREYFSGKLSFIGSGEGERIVFDLSSDFAINGEEFKGLVKFAFDVMGMGMGIQVASETAPAQPSMMLGDVVRPAVLDDTAFQNWFTGIINNAMTVLMNSLSALPESVLTLVMGGAM